MILRRNSRRRNRSGVKPRRHFCDSAGKCSFVRRRKVCRQGRCDIAFLSMRRTLSTARRRIERLPSSNAAESSILSYNTVRINVEVSVPAVFTARRTPEGGALPRLSSGLVQRFKQCRVEEPSKLAFRLFPWRGGSLSACRAGTPRVFRPNPVRHFSQCCGETLKLAFRTLSVAQRLVVRLQGGQQCRRTTEIRSEVSRPPDLFRTASPRNRKVSSLLLSRFGRAGATANASAHFSYLFRSVSLDRYIHMPHHRPSSQVTLGSAQTRQGTLGSLDSPSAAASSTERHSTLKHRRKPLPQRRSAVASHLVPTRNAPQRSARRPPAR